MTKNSLRLGTVAIAALLLGISAAMAATCTSPVKDSDLIKPGTLVMSTNPTLPPLQFVDSSGELKGMRIELGTEIAKRLCLTPEYVKIDFDAMVPGLQGGRWDMSNTGIVVACDVRPRRLSLLQETITLMNEMRKGNAAGVAQVVEGTNKS